VSGFRAAVGASSARRLLHALPSVLFYLAAGVAAYFLWPTSLGGCTTLTVVSGESMEPTYFTGDVVVARCGDPKIGDAVVYQPKDFGGARIIHRIISGDESGWTLQGDNNDWLDPFTPSNDEVLGVAKVHLPKVGLAARALTSPFVWLGLIAIALAILLWPTGDDELEDDTDDREDSSEDAPDTLTESPSVTDAATVENRSEPEAVTL